MPSKNYLLPIFVLSSRPIIVSAFQFKNDANFKKCTQNVIQWTASGAFFNNSPIFKQDPEHPGVLTFAGCEQTCGRGFQIWSLQDLILRFNIWIIPAVVLIIHFAFPPLGFKNKASVIIHMIGDPIDSIWSLLMRQESLLRLYHHSVDQSVQDTENQSIALHIGTIWSAYEEVGCQDASKYFSDALNSRNLQPWERDVIRRAGIHLLLNRSDSQFNNLVGVGVLLVAMAAAYMRTQQLIGQSATEISHTIAVMTLLFYLLPLVLISGTMGSFTSALVPVNEIKELHQNLPSLFPQLDFQAEEWLSAACWTGMNSCWRPRKVFAVREYNKKKNLSSPLLFFAAFSFVVFGSYFPAVFLSATNHALFRPRGYGPLAFACRSTSWSIVAFLWLLSVIIDLGFGWKNKANARSLWISIRLKDGVITLLIICVVLIVQVGFLNSCWCRSNWMDFHANAVVALLPLNHNQQARAWKIWISLPLGFLALTLGLTTFFIWRGWAVRRLLFKDQEDLQADLLQGRLRLLPQRHGETGDLDREVIVETVPSIKG